MMAVLAPGQPKCNATGARRSEGLALNDDAVSLSWQSEVSTLQSARLYQWPELTQLHP
jgi:hypothetical protein